MYGKFFASTFTGSMFGAGTDVFAVWGYVIANADASGVVELNPSLIAAVLGASPDRIKTAIDVLSSPDAASRSVNNQGRRLAHEGGYQYLVVNHAAYRSIRNEEERRAYNRDAKRRERARKVKPPVIDKSALSAYTDVEGDVKVDVQANVRTTPPIGVEAAAAQKAPEAAPEPPHAPIPSARPSTLITSPAAYQRLQKTCAFVGSALQVPHVLHGEFLRKVGADGETRLQAWYLALNQQLEASGEGYGDAFAYLRPRFAAWATPPPPRQAAPARAAMPPSQGGDRDAEAIQQQLETRRRRAEMLAIGMSPEAIEEVFDQEYEARKAAKENR